MTSFFLLLMGILLLLAGGYQYQLTELLKRDGVRTKAVVHAIERPILPTTIYPGPFEPEPSAKVTLCFQTTEAKWVAVRYREGTPSERKVGEQLDIVYDPANPDDFLLDSNPGYGPPLLMIAVGLGLLGFGFYRYLLG